MLKLFIVVAGLSALTLSTMPASAQDAANQCRATAATAHVKVFNGSTGQLSQAPRGAAAGYDALTTIEGVPGESSATTAREHGSRAAVGRRSAAYAPGFTGGVRVAAGDVNGDGAADGARMGCQNNLKQLGTASH